MLLSCNPRQSDKYDLTTKTWRSNFVGRRRVSAVFSLLFLFCFGVLAWLGYKKNNDPSSADSKTTINKAYPTPSWLSFVEADLDTLTTQSISYRTNTMKNEVNSTWNHSKSRDHTIESQAGRSAKSQHSPSITFMQGSAIGAASSGQNPRSTSEG